MLSNIGYQSMHAMVRKRPVRNMKDGGIPMGGGYLRARYQVPRKGKVEPKGRVGGICALRYSIVRYKIVVQGY